jgi:hypothetical protein
LGTFAACWRTATAAQALTNTPPFSLASATTSDVSLHAQRCNIAVVTVTCALSRHPFKNALRTAHAVNRCGRVALSATNRHHAPSNCSA